MNGRFHVYACKCLGGGRESISNQHFLVVVKRANRSAWFISHALYVTSWRDTSWQTAASIFFFFYCGHTLKLYIIHVSIYDIVCSVHLPEHVHFT